jgi:hypothetical protein
MKWYPDDVMGGGALVLHRLHPRQNPYFVYYYSTYPQTET